MRLSACIEWLFADEAEAFEERIRLAAEAGLPAVEFWMWRNKNLLAIERALKDHGVVLTSFVSEPRGRLVDPGTHDEFLRSLEESVEVAERLGARGLIVLSGDALGSVDRGTQQQALIQALRRAAPIAENAGIDLLLEPLNTRVDHPGYFLNSTAEGFAILRAVNSPRVKMLSFALSLDMSQVELCRLRGVRCAPCSTVIEPLGCHSASSVRKKRPLRIA